MDPGITFMLRRRYNLSRQVKEKQDHILASTGLRGETDYDPVAGWQKI